MIIGLLVVANVLGGAEPTIDIIPGQLYEYGACLKEVEARDGLPPEQFDSKGRVILSTQAYCIILDRDYLAAQLDALGSL